MRFITKQANKERKEFKNKDIHQKKRHLSHSPTSSPHTDTREVSSFETFQLFSIFTIHTHQKEETEKVDIISAKVNHLQEKKQQNVCGPLKNSLPPNSKKTISSSSNVYLVSLDTNEVN